MKKRKNAYELSQSQIATPKKIVPLFWNLIRKRRKILPTILDMGAGDCRLAAGEMFEKYVGVEIDKSQIRENALPPNGRIIHNCAFRHRGSAYDACIGNPPYVRHHDIESPWKEETIAKLESLMNVKFNKHCNLYIYFLSLGLLKTHSEGLLALLIPYEWVSRPSAEAVRKYIRKNHWDVHVYRFEEPIFEGVLTTASVSIVDKQSRNGKWSYYDVTKRHKIQPRRGAANSKDGVLNYERRGALWAMRGLSPGSQKVFTLTEGERIHFGLSIDDVVPCVTTLKNLPREMSLLSKATFKRHFRDAGRRCWLIKSYAAHHSPSLDAYLNSVPVAQRDNYTCRHQSPWYNFTTHPIPKLLISSGFTEFGPKVLVNGVGATAVGSVFGVHGKTTIPLGSLRRDLSLIDFEKQVVAHARTLKKIEVKQFNAVLNKLSRPEKPHGKGPTKG